ncbi:MAG: glycosyltransferase family 39 protein [Oscillatoria sp. PMC 1051.18]|nr:glycosyltransferase family 39 protein [Oscillatoria sp. PMC 1050.18]MEC5031633.1 glycosyltransferase family 39 protein [Oscillatoria sp. PMC 1051.18]
MKISFWQEKFKLSGFHLFILVVLLWGIWFRFVNIDRKIPWIDEWITLDRITDYDNRGEIQEKLFGGEVITVQELHELQRIDSQTNTLEFLNNSLVNYPEHPPIYYLFARLWGEWFGTSIATLRSAAAAISLFVFPAMFWLCYSLFDSYFASWLGVALIAVSPLHVLYAQEARQYSLWTVTILLSSAALLQAMQHKNKLSWLTYAVTLTVGFYSHLFFSLVAFAQGIYVILREGFHFSKTLLAYFLTTLASIIAFLPWIVVAFTSLSHLDRQVKGWTEAQPTLFTFLKRWLGNLSRLFADFGFDSSTNLSEAISIIPLIFFLTILVIYACYFLVRNSSREVWLFVLTLIICTTAILVGRDLLVVFGLVSGRLFSATARYIIPFYLGIHLAVVYFLASKMSSQKVNEQKFGRGVFLALISLGIFSCIISSQAEVWWSKGEASELVQVAPIINQATNSLVVSDADLARILSLSNLLNDQVHLQLFVEANYYPIDETFSNIFVLNPSESLQQILEKEYQLESLRDTEIQLWKLEQQ